MNGNQSETPIFSNRKSSPSHLKVDVNPKFPKVPDLWGFKSQQGVEWILVGLGKFWRGKCMGKCMVVKIGGGNGG